MLRTNGRKGRRTRADGVRGSGTSQTLHDEKKIWIKPLYLNEGPDAKSVGWKRAWRGRTEDQKT